MLDVEVKSLRKVVAVFPVLGERRVTMVRTVVVPRQPCIVSPYFGVTLRHAMKLWEQRHETFDFSHHSKIIVCLYKAPKSINTRIQSKRPWQYLGIMAGGRHYMTSPPVFFLQNSIHELIEIPLVF